MIENLEDFRKKYKGTYIFLEFNGKKELVYYAGDSDGTFKVLSKKYGNLLVDEATARESFTYYFPEIGLYNVKGIAQNFVRMPNRQWKRAPCSDNAHLRSILTRWFRDSSGITIESLDEVYNPKYPTSLEQALLNLKTSMALNLKFAVSLSHLKNPNKYLLWYGQSPIGFVDKSDRTIEVKTPHMYQEVADFVKYKENSWTLLKN